MGQSALPSAAASVVDPDDDDDRLSVVSGATSNVSTVSRSTILNAKIMKFGGRVTTKGNTTKTKEVVIKLW